MFYMKTESRHLQNKQKHKTFINLWANSHQKHSQFLSKFSISRPISLVLALQFVKEN